MRNYERLNNRNTVEIEIGHLEALRESISKVYESGNKDIKDIKRIAGGDCEALIKDILEHAKDNINKLDLIDENLEEYLTKEEI